MLSNVLCACCVHMCVCNGEEEEGGQGGGDGEGWRMRRKTENDLFVVLIENHIKPMIS